MVKVDYAEEIKRMKQEKAEREKEKKLRQEYNKLKEEENPNYIKKIFKFIGNLFLNILEAFGIYER